jgi:tetratricopeptide (TPR) repeat protein
MFRCPTLLALLGILLGLAADDCFGHADLDTLIDDVTQEIEKSPDGAGLPELYFRRANLHRLHVEFDKAQGDLDEAQRLRPGWKMLLLGQARIEADQGRTEEALRIIGPFLETETNNTEALILRARWRERAGQHGAALADYTLALALIPAVTPDVLLERADIQARLGRLGDAIAGLDEGIKKSGPLPTLVLPAIEYERQAKRFDAALHRVGQFIERYPVKEPWRALRGEILEQAERRTEAAETFQTVLAGLAAYPEARRKLDLTKHLEARVRAGLLRLQTSSNPVPSTETPP